jgi:uncharacterized DUF497 family protein
VQTKAEENLDFREQYVILLLACPILDLSGTLKASSNEKKHGVSFGEDALVIPDPDHSQVEDRFIILGRSSEDRALVVVHSFRAAGSVIRIISARRAGTKEQKPYWENKS